MSSSKIDSKDELHNIPYEMVPKNNSYVIERNGMIVKEQPSFSYEANKNYGNLRIHHSTIEDLIFNSEPPQKDPLMN